MNTEWIELHGIEAVAIAKGKRWEIELDVSGNSDWQTWNGKAWISHKAYRGRPAQPKNVTVISMCWRDKEDGTLLWREPGKAFFNEFWQRFPAGDITGEIEK